MFTGTFLTAFVVFGALAVISAGAMFTTMAAIFTALAIIATGAVFTSTIRIFAFCHNKFSLKSIIPIEGINVEYTPWG